MILDDFLNITYGYPNRDVYIFEESDYDDVIDLIDDGEFDIERIEYMSCTKLNQAYKSRMTFRKEIWGSEVLNIVLNGNDVYVFIDYDLFGTKKKEQKEDGKTK